LVVPQAIEQFGGTSLPVRGHGGGNGLAEPVEFAEAEVEEDFGEGARARRNP
jgi:hypothetical protein